MTELTAGKVVRDDKGKTLGVFGKPEAESFVADVNKAIGAPG